MKQNFLSATLCLVFLFPVYLVQSSIDEFRWKHRLLIVETSNADALQQWEKLYEKQATSFEDRELIVLINGIDGNLKQIPSTGNTKVRSSVDTESFVPLSDSEFVTLVGLDGGVKDVVPLKKFNIQEIFDQIDRMPMRASELRKRSQNRAE